MAKHNRYRWQPVTQIDRENPPPVTTRRVEPNPGWRKIVSNRKNECSCGCGTQIKIGTPIMWDRVGGHVLTIDCAKRMGVLL